MTPPKKAHLKNCFHAQTLKVATDSQHDQDRTSPNNEPGTAPKSGILQQKKGMCTSVVSSTLKPIKSSSSPNGFSKAECQDFAGSTMTQAFWTSKPFRDRKIFQFFFALHFLSMSEHQTVRGFEVPQRLG